MKIISGFFVVFTLGLIPITFAEDSPSRYIKGGIFVSESLPSLQLRVDKRFSYLGNLNFILKEIARVDRHYWVDAEDEEVRALVVLQFEGFLDGVDEKYRFSVPDRNFAGSNYRFTTKPVRLGSYDYVHNTWAFDHAADARNNPGAESARSIEFLVSKGYKLDDELIMSRFVRAVGEESRNELILFYMEPLALHGHSVAEFPDGGPVSEVYDRLSALVTERSLSAIKILSEGK